VADVDERQGKPVSSNGGEEPPRKRGLVRELIRRRVLPIAIAYSVSAWVIVEIASVILPAFNAPDWALQGIILLALAGFFVAVIVAWIFDITPGGIVKTDEVDAARARETEKARHLATERRQLTVVHVRMKWLTGAGSNHDAETVREALARLIAGISETIESFEGSVFHVGAQQLTACFGYPTALEYDAQYAARAALAIADTIQAFNDEALVNGSPRVETGIGLDTGTAVIERKGEDFKIIGSLAERTEWLASVAGDDAIAVSGDSQALLNGYFSLDHLDEQAAVPGSPVSTVYRLVGEDDRRSRLDTRGSLTALIGRKPELAMLEQRWAQARDGQGQVVVIAGESGVGKSRLAHELKRQVADEGDGHIAEFVCYADYQNSVLHPVSDYLRRQIGSPAGGTDAAGQVAALERRLAVAGLSLPDAMPLMLDLLGLEADERYPARQLAPALQKSKTLEQLLALLLGQQDDEPRLLLIDDYQWADASFRELMEMVIAQGPSVRALIVFTTRPEGLPEWVTRSHVTQINVSPLTSAETKALIAAIGERTTLPETVIERLVSNSQGNPLFVEELTRAVLDMEPGAPEAGIATDSDNLDIPLTLQESLAARLDRLNVDARTVVRLAATIGRRFDYDLSRAFAEILEVDDFDENLQQLVAADIIYQRGLPPNASYAFRHVLIQEAAYQSILKSERASYHQRIADLLRERFESSCDKRPELLARHLTRAGRIEEAIPRWLDAGRLAARKAAHVEACSLLQQALQLLDQLPESAQRDALELEIQIALGPALMAVHGYSAQQVRDAYRRAEQLSNQAESTIAIAPVLFGLWAHHVVAGNLTRAMSLGQRLHSIAESSGNEDLVIESHVLLGVTQSYIGPMAESLEHLSQAVSLYDQDRHANHAFIYGQDPKMASLSDAAIPHWWLGYTLTASNCVEDGIAHARRINHPRSLAFALANGARTELKRGDYLRCIEIGSEANRVSEKHGYPDFRAMGRFHQLAGEWRVDPSDGTLTALRETLDALVAVGNSLSMPYYHSVLADILSLEGQFEEALAALTFADQQLKKHGNDLDAVEVYRVHGLVEWRQQQAGDNVTTEPDVALRRAHDLAVRQGAVSWRLLAATSLAEWLESHGDAEQARTTLAAALEAMPEQGHLPAFNDANRILDRVS
jgi:class 3 adenylate cyclase/tetratricopeptide (TPR) repeat protein